MRRHNHARHISGWDYYEKTDEPWASMKGGFFAPSLEAAKDYAERHFGTRNVRKAEPPQARRNPEEIPERVLQEAEFHEGITGRKASIWRITKEMQTGALKGMTLDEYTVRVAGEPSLEIGKSYGGRETGGKYKVLSVVKVRNNPRRRNPPEAKVKAGSFTAKLRERTADGWHNTTAKLDGYLSDNGLWFIHKAVKGGPLGLNNAWVLMYTPNSGLWPFNEPQTSASIKKLLADMPPELYNAADPMDMQDYASDFLHSRRRNPAHEGDREQRIAAIHTAQTARGPRYTVHFGYARWVKGEFTAAKARKASQTFTSRAKADAASDKWIAKGV